VIMSDQFFSSRIERLAALTIRQAMPAFTSTTRSSMPAVW